MRFVKLTSMIVLVLIVLTMVSCSSQTPIASPGVATEPESSSNDPTAIPVPTDDKAVLTGTLVQKGVDGNPDRPYEGLRVFLGTLIVSDDGKSTLARVNSLEAPQAITDMEGKFVFNDLKPDTYILVLQVPPNMLIKLNDPDTGQDKMIDVPGGTVTDIGPQYHDLPWFTIPTP